MKENDMQLAREEYNTGWKNIATTVARHEGKGATLAAAVKAWAGLGILVLSFAANLAYVVQGGAFVSEASPIPEPETSIATFAVKPVDAGSGPRKE
jgi:hypothetical protein